MVIASLPYTTEHWITDSSDKKQIGEQGQVQRILGDDFRRIIGKALALKKQEKSDDQIGQAVKKDLFRLSKIINKAKEFLDKTIKQLGFFPYEGANVDITKPLEDKVLVGSTEYPVLQFADSVDEKISEMALKIAKKYSEQGSKRLTLLVLTRGALPIGGLLFDRIHQFAPDLDIRFEDVKAKSRDGIDGQKELALAGLPDDFDPRGDFLIVDDVADSGVTLAGVFKYLTEKIDRPLKGEQISVAALYDKANKRIDIKGEGETSEEIEADRVKKQAAADLANSLVQKGFTGFIADKDEWLMGRGMDTNNWGRQFADVWKGNLGLLDYAK